MSPQWYNSFMPRTRILVLISTFLILTVVGGFAIMFARGYRIDTGDDTLSLSPRGLLVANSDPNGAQVYVNGELRTATNNTISLRPDEYEIEIKKQGFLTWRKSLVIEQEEVTQVDAFLLPAAPSLTALTFSGAQSPTVTNDFTKVAYIVTPPIEESPDPEDEERVGLWVFESVNLPLGFNRDPRQITDGNLTGAMLEWSPTGRNILISLNEQHYLLDVTTFTATTDRVLITETQLIQLKSDWAEEEEKRLGSLLGKLPDVLTNFFMANTADIRFAPDETKMLYRATSPATLPENLIPQLPGASTQVQNRTLETDIWYVFDIKEDKNFKVASGEERVYWIANSLNLVKPLETGIQVLDYDGTNVQTVYSGSYIFPNAFPSTSSGRIIILANFGAADAAPNLYWLSLR